MKIFVSHSSKQKLFIKELKRYLPTEFNLWIDEKDISMGNDIEQDLFNAINYECDFLILIIDQFSIKSHWVKKEIEWALIKEKELKRIFLLPIVLDDITNIDLENISLKNRKYLKCHDFLDSSIQGVINSLVSELIKHLCSIFDNNKDKKSNVKNEYNIIESANKIYSEIEKSIKTILIPYRIKNHLFIEDLFIKLRNDLSNLKIEKPFNFLTLMRERGYLKGIYFDEEIIYMEKESYQYKSDLNNILKKKIAKHALTYIRPGQKIAIDGSSTTFELSKLISSNLLNGTLYDLKIVSNSVIIINNLLNTLSQLNVRDNNSICELFILGGRARPTSMNIISEKDTPSKSIDFTLKSIFDTIGHMDIGFLGTNGVKNGIGFSNQNLYELSAKKDILTHSKLKIVLTDPSKFEVEQEEVFAFFNDNIKVITSNSPEYNSAINNFQDMISNTSTELIIV